jgi:aryl-alcohol dehydrogenase-like predicted oxidoreductase
MDGAGTLSLDGLTVNRLGFGAMRITGRGIWGEPERADEARAVLRRAVELGVDFVDTAHSYGPEVSERLIGETLRPYPDGLVVATKSGFARSGPDRCEADCRPETVRADCERSLQLLGVDRIDLLQLHTVDPRVPYEESVGAIAELQREGKVRCVGISNVDVEHLRRARAVTGIVSVQNRYSLWDRRSEAVLEACEADGIAFIPWAPIGGTVENRTRLAEVAREVGATETQVALAWLLRRSPVMLPIPGTSSVAHLEENVAAASVELSDEQARRLES